MPNSYPYDLIGPVTIIWRPTTSLASSDPARSPRTVWFICHPSLFESAFRSLVVSSSLAVEASKSDNRRKHKIEVFDLRGKFNIFELMGPKSSQIIKGTLNPVFGDEHVEFKQVSFAPSSLTKTECITHPLVLGWATVFTVPWRVATRHGCWYESS